MEGGGTELGGGRNGPKKIGRREKMWSKRLGRGEKLAQKLGRREKLAQKVERREIWSPVPPPSTCFKLRFNQQFKYTTFRYQHHISLTWWDGHVGVQNNGKMSLQFCIMIESNSPPPPKFSLLFCTPIWPPWRHLKTENTIWRYLGICTARTVFRWLPVALGFFTSSVTLTAFFTEDDPERETTRSPRCHKIGHVLSIK